MKTKLISILLLCAMLLSAGMLVSCFPAMPEEGSVTRMTVDINPSVEFMIDDQNRVVSVTALNDDGSILIAGEAFIGKTPEEAVAMTVTLASETGYLVQGNVEATENTVKISVSGDSDYAQRLKEQACRKASEKLEELDIEGKVEQAEALKLEQLRELALKTGLYTEEELLAMNEEQLYRVLAQSRVETALLLTEEMREVYYAAKEHKISFAESEATAKIIEGLGGLYSVAHKAYKGALDLYSAAILEIDEFRYDMLVSPDSDYQKSLAKLREAKVELLEQRTYTASLEIDGEEYASASATLQMKEEHYEEMLAAYERIGTELNEALEGLIGKLKEAETKLRELEDVLFDENIKEKLQEKAYEIEAEVNAAKDAFFAEFEAAHAEDIQAIEDALLSKKEELKDKIQSAE